MKDQLNEIGKKLLARLDLTVLGVLVAILIATSYLFLSESGYTVPPPPDRQIKSFTAKLPVDGENYEAQENYVEAVERVRDRFVSTSKSIQEDPEMTRLIRRNMFSKKSVDEQVESARELNQRYQEAERDFRQQNYEAARSKLDEILQQDPNHVDARALKNQIEELLSPSSGDSADSS